MTDAAPEGLWYRTESSIERGGPMNPSFILSRRRPASIPRPNIGDTPPNPARAKPAVNPHREGRYLRLSVWLRAAYGILLHQKRNPQAKPVLIYHIRYVAYRAPKARVSYSYVSPRIYTRRRSRQSPLRAGRIYPVHITR